MFWTFLTSTIKFSTLFLYGSVGETITEKSGHLNLGIPGIMCLGAIGGCYGVRSYIDSLGSLSQMSGFAVVVVGIICAFLFAALGGMIFSFFTVTLRCNQNITGLTITTFGIALNSLMLSKLDTRGFYEAGRLFAKGIVDANTTDGLVKVLFSQSALVYIAIATAIITAIVIKRTRVGLNLRAVGENPATADAAGISVGKYRYLATLIGSGIAGLGGLFFIMDFLTGNIEYGIDTYGWLAVALVIFTIWKPNWAILGSIIFAALYRMPIYLNIGQMEREIIKMLPYIVTVLVLIITSIFGRKSVQPPAALGTTYFREER